MNKFKIGDRVRHLGNIGVIRKYKIIRGLGLFKDYTLYRVKFNEIPAEWINEKYLTKQSD